MLPSSCSYLNPSAGVSSDETGQGSDSTSSGVRGIAVRGSLAGNVTTDPNPPTIIDHNTLINTPSNTPRRRPTNIP